MDKLSYEELEKLINDAKQKVSPGSKWRHYKGGEYIIVGFAILEETQEVAVIYSPLTSPNVSFARPVSVWGEDVEWEGQTVKRFAPFV